MSCYSDHDEDVRTKGSCDYCRGTERDEFDDPVPDDNEAEMAFRIAEHESWLASPEADYLFENGRGE